MLQVSVVWKIRKLLSASR